jgi:hypothetical protein
VEALGGLVASTDGSTSKKPVARVTFSDCIEEVIPTSGNNFVDSEELNDKYQILDRKLKRKMKENHRRNNLILQGLIILKPANNESRTVPSYNNYYNLHSLIVISWTKNA